MSEFLKEWAEKHRAEFYSHVPMWVAIGSEACKAARRQLSYAEYAGLITLLEGANSYTRKVLLPLLDDDAVCELAEHCMSQIGPECGELELARHYGDSLERELAPMLVRRLRWLSHRVGRLETELSGAAVLTAAQRKEIAQLLLDKTDYLTRCVVACHDLKKQLQIAETKLGADAAELDHARREAAAWEVQCQDLRDRLTQPPDMTAVEATIEQWNAGTINRAELQAGLRAAFDRTPSSPGTLEIGSHCVVPSESTAIISANEIAAARKMS